VGLAAVAAVVGWPGAARAADRPQISVAPVTSDRATPELRQRVAQALAEGLIASGADVATPAQAREASYLLRAKLDVEGRSYALRLEMVDRKTGAVLASLEDRCEICTETEAFETANTAASTLKALVFRRQGASSSSTQLASPTVVPAATPTGAPPALVETGGGEPPPRSGRRHVLG